jgi:2-polyprenyl-3-methyl-5-hydroxy-6-metoxy-1,4-benzoquinol methylase
MGDAAGSAVAAPQACGDDWLEPLERCPVCLGRESRLLHAGLIDDTFHSIASAFDLHLCAGCGAAFLNPRLRREHIGLAYARYYTHEKPSRYLGDAGSARRWRYALRRTAFARLLPLGRIDFRSLPRMQRLVAPLAARLLSRSLDEALRGLPRDRIGELLDVGFGDGAFMELAALAGWRSAGVDLDPVTVANARARGLDVQQASIGDLPVQGRRFDFISMSHTIEHVHDPREEVRCARELLRPGGLLYVETPNIQSAGHRRYGRHWRGLEPPRHLVLFSWRALERLLDEAGFTVVRRIVKTQPFARLAAQSEALARGRSIVRIEVRPRHRLLRLRARMAVLADATRSEFITLLARRDAA